jgi:hypothetical protein
MAHNIHIGQKTKTMKNIYVLPTNKLSRLYLGKNGNFVFGMMQTSVQSKNDHFCNQHIYIISDKEIKVGDWFLPQGNINPHKLKEYNKINGDLESYNGLCYDISKCKKIILTTDQDLIKDGVQAIDDEFLEWFVNNPSCEEVEVEKGYLGMGGFCKSNEIISKDKIHYKIIIPKEEPKQETLEEAAEINCESITHPYCDREKAMFIKGAKWQQEQDKNKYSEEEVFKLLKEFNKQTLQLQKLKLGNNFNVKEWFEQFKKK